MRCDDGMFYCANERERECVYVCVRVRVCGLMYKNLRFHCGDGLPREGETERERECVCVCVCVPVLYVLVIERIGLGEVLMYLGTYKRERERILHRGGVCFERNTVNSTRVY